MQGIMVRAKIRWAEEGEKPTKYFCHFESRNYIIKTIFKVTTDNGNTITIQEDILEVVKKFYSNLYQTHDVCENDDIQRIFNKLTECSKLTVEERDKLEGEISSEEILFVLKNMKNNKSPGSDGLSVEFFNFFHKDIMEFIKSAINE